MPHLDTAFKLGAWQAQRDFQVELNKIAAPVSADFQSRLNALAMAPGEAIQRSAPAAASGGGAWGRGAPGPGENRPLAGIVPRSGGPGETVGTGSLTGGKLRAPSVGLGREYSPSSVQAPAAVAGVQQPGRTQPSAVAQSMGMQQRGQALQTPRPGPTGVSPALAAVGPVNAGASAPMAGLKTPSWARRA